MNDETAIGYDKTLNLNDGTITATPVGVVFYTGKQVGIATSSTAYKNQMALGDRTLAMLIDTTGSTLTFEKTGGVWAIANTSAHTDRKLELVVYDDAGNAPFYNYNGTYSGILDPCEVSSTFLDSNDPNKNMLVFDIPYNPQLSDNIKDAKCYFPSVAELLELYEQFEPVNDALGVLTEVGGMTLGGERYWSCSQVAGLNTMAWSVGFPGYEESEEQGRAEHSDKKTEYAVLGIIEYKNYEGGNKASN